MGAILSFRQGDMKLPTVCHVNLAKGFRGGERQTALIVAGLSKFLQSQIMVCRKGSPLKSELSGVKGVEIIEVSGRLSGHFAVSADILHAHEAKAAHWCLAHHFLRRTPYVITRRVPQKLKSGWFTRTCHQKATKLVGISSVISGYLETVSPHNVVTINSALAHLPQDKEESAKIRDSFPGKYLIGHIGAYVDRHKGQRTIIEAARIMKDSEPDAQFVLLGAGSDEEILKSESADLDNICWAGFHKNVGDYLGAFDAFAFPSRNEGLGSTLLDAMDFSLPIVASDVDGIPDVIENGKSGILIPPGDGQKLAAELTKIKRDKDLAKRLAAGGKARTEKFTPEAMAEKYFRLYGELLAKEKA